MTKSGVLREVCQDIPYAGGEGGGDYAKMLGRRACKFACFQAQAYNGFCSVLHSVTIYIYIYIYERADEEKHQVSLLLGRGWNGGDQYIPLQMVPGSKNWANNPYQRETLKN